MSFRQSEILAIARVEGRVTVEHLAERFLVTLQTIRRDLTALTESGFLDRVHGGAVLAAGLATDLYEQRRRVNEQAKAAIARACAAAIRPNTSVMINVGTTTEAVARALRHHSGMRVVTNSLRAARTLMSNPECEVIVAGGALRRSDGGLMGDLTSHVFGQFDADYGVIGCLAIDAAGDLHDDDLEGVRAAQTIIAQSRNTFLVADQTKLARKAAACVASLQSIATFFTDAPLPEPLATRCRDWGTAVTQA